MVFWLIHSLCTCLYLSHIVCVVLLLGLPELHNCLVFLKTDTCNTIGSDKPYGPSGRIASTVASICYRALSYPRPFSKLPTFHSTKEMGQNRFFFNVK